VSTIGRVDRPSPPTGPARSSRPPRAARVRLDQLLVERGLVETRSRAQALLLAGRVRVGAGDGARFDRKPGDLVDDATAVEVAAPLPYVSRGGEKLAGALDAFGLSPAGLVCLDAGASTGGFTDVLLKRGAARVHAVDVGRGQLAPSLAGDPRVIVHDRVNARHLEPATLGEAAALAVIDVSFISLGLVLGPVAGCLAPGGRIVALVKPQFEAGRGEVPGGVVRDPAVHRAVLERVLSTAGRLSLVALDVVRSPLLGPAGNREFFVHLALPEPQAPDRALVEERPDLAARIAECTAA
jgi:23S rRNA (cytidine1920-2'-O)/16S rRNA (cytidine1409-2'-O)-methyltransferase